MKVYILYRRQYGDFDILQPVPVAASTNKAAILAERDRMNEDAPEDGNGGDYYVDTKNPIPLI